MVWVFLRVIKGDLRAKYQSLLKIIFFNHKKKMTLTKNSKSLHLSHNYHVLYVQACV